MKYSFRPINIIFIFTFLVRIFFIPFLFAQETLRVPSSIHKTGHRSAPVIRKEEFKKSIDDLKVNPDSVSYAEFEKILDEIVKMNRLNLIASLEKYYTNPLSPLALEGNCGEAQSDIKDIFDFLITSNENTEIRIYQAKDLFKGLYHGFSVIRFKEKYYLVDTTFGQFFVGSRKVSEAHPLKSQRKLFYPWYIIEQGGNYNWLILSRELLEKGYMELTDETADMYGCLLSGKLNMDNVFNLDDIISGPLTDSEYTSEQLEGMFGALKNRCFYHFDEKENIKLIYYCSNSLYLYRKPDKSEILSKALEYNNPWDVAEAFEKYIIPLFVSTEHVSTYSIVLEGIEQGILSPENTVVLNFDRHHDMYGDNTMIPISNNWLRILMHKKKVAMQFWFDAKKHRIEDFREHVLLKEKDIVVSIDMDYFENVSEGEFVNAMDRIINLVRTYNKSVKAISMALSPSYCIKVDPEKISRLLCDKLKTTFSPDRSYLSRVSYLFKYGVCLKEKNRITPSQQNLAVKKYADFRTDL